MNAEIPFFELNPDSLASPLNCFHIMKMIRIVTRTSIPKSDISDLCKVALTVNRH